MSARRVHPIERESYRRLRARVDTSGLSPLARAVAERVVHSSADLSYLDDLVLPDESVLRAAADALAAGAPIVADVQMVAAGITSRPALCRIREAKGDPATGLTRSAAAVRLALAEVGPGAVWVVGCAPTALEELLRLDARPALVIGLPVGFVGAAESKAALRASGLPSVSNVSEKGGSAVAAAAVNALLYPDLYADPGTDPPDGAPGIPTVPTSPIAPAAVATPGTPTTPTGEVAAPPSADRPLDVPHRLESL